MELVKQAYLKGERALFKSHDLKVEDSIFADGESPLKESVPYLKRQDLVFGILIILILKIVSLMLLRLLEEEHIFLWKMSIWSMLKKLYGNVKILSYKMWLLKVITLE